MTVRTVRYYERVGLLRPTARSEADQRLYSDGDFARLQQILTLKLLGLSLDAIRRLLTSNAVEITDLLEQQKRALRAQAQALQQVSDLIERAQSALVTSGVPDIEQTIEIIRAVTTMNTRQWLAQFLDEDQQAAMAEAETSAPFADQRAAGLAWQALFADIQQQRQADVRDPAVQALVDRWDALVAASTGGDLKAEHGVNRAYEALDTLPDLTNAPPEARAWVESVRDAAALIAQARAARESGSGW